MQSGRLNLFALAGTDCEEFLRGRQRSGNGRGDLESHCRNGRELHEANGRSGESGQVALQSKPSTAKSSATASATISPNSVEDSGFTAPLPGCVRIRHVDHVAM